MSDEPTIESTAELSPPQRRLPQREIKFQFSSQFVPILRHLGCSLLASTYAAGKVAAIGSGDDGLRLGFSNFQQAMGIADNTFRVVDSRTGVDTSGIPLSGDPRDLVAFNNRLFFTTLDDFADRELGTSQGTVGASGSNDSTVVAFHGRLSLRESLFLAFLSCVVRRSKRR